MNDTTLQAYALEKGIKKSTSEMTNQEKIGLAMEMFMEKTTYAAGNYAKENETLAGSLGTAKAALSNFLSGAGSVEDVVSSFSNFANVVVKNITTMFPALMTGMTQLVNQLVPMIPPLLEQVLPGLIEGATGLINGLVAAMPQIVQALLSAAPALIEGVTLVMNALIDALPELLQSLVAALPTLIPALLDGIVSMIVTLVSNLPKILPVLIEGIILLTIGIVDALPTIIQALVDSLPMIIEMIIVGLFEARESLINGAIRLVGALVGALPQILMSLRLALPQAFIGIWNGIKNIFLRIPEFFIGRFNAVVEGISKVFLGVKDAILLPFNYVKDKVEGIANKIKGFFKGEISMPKIKMPHFTVSPSGWKIADLLKGSIPKLGIEWYAKAMNNPMVMTSPTIFGYNAETGKLQGGGESGSEVVSGTGTLMNMIQGAVASQNNTIVVYLQHLIEILETYFPQILEAAGHDIVTDDGTVIAHYVPKIDEALGKLKIRKDRGR